MLASSPRGGYEGDGGSDGGEAGGVGGIAFVFVFEAAATLCLLASTVVMDVDSPLDAANSSSSVMDSNASLLASNASNLTANVGTRVLEA